MSKVQKKLGEILMEKGLITQEQLDLVLEEQSRTKKFLGEVLIKHQLITEHDLLSTLSEQFNYPVVSLKNKYINWELVRTFSPSLILDYKCFPVSSDEYSVTMALNNPLDLWVMQKAEQEAGGLRLKVVLVSLEDLEDAIFRYKQYLQKNITNF